MTDKPCYFGDGQPAVDEAAANKDMFPRCASATKDGRRCWKAPDHLGRHLVLPDGSDTTKSRQALRRILRERPDVPHDVILATFLVDAGVADNADFRKVVEN